LRLLLHPANFLLLDEPTNHLDIRAKDILLEALAAYTGTVVLVSHDRYFIDKLATRVFEVGDGRVEVYPGNYEEYLWRKQGRSADVPTLADLPGHRSPRNGGPPAAGPSAIGKGSASAQPANGNQASAPAGAVEESKSKRLNPIKRKQMEERIHEVEQAIARTESAIAHCETALLTFVSVEESQRQSQELEARRSELGSLMAEWEELSQTLEAAN
jgi:ATP-binding cassette, subfamily F, member 3